VVFGSSLLVLVHCNRLCWCDVGLMVCIPSICDHAGGRESMLLDRYATAKDTRDHSAQSNCRVVALAWMCWMRKIFSSGCKTTVSSWPNWVEHVEATVACCGWDFHAAMC